MKTPAAIVLALAALALPCAATGAASDASHPKSEAALACYLGYSAAICPINDCNGGDGPVERVEYLGADARGGDVYEVKYRHRNKAYVVGTYPGATAGQYRIAPADHYWVKATVTAPATAGLIYARPRNTPVVSACAILYPNGDGWNGGDAGGGWTDSGSYQSGGTMH